MILLTILTSFVALICTIPNARAEEITTTSTTKGLSVISQVAGFDPTKYHTVPTLAAVGPNFGNLPTENIRYTLDSNLSHIEILETYSGNHLQIIDVLQNSGSLQPVTAPLTSVGMAENFLLRYQAYTANSFYGQLASMLNEADSTKNSTVIIGNIKLDVTIIAGNFSLENMITFTWYYTAGGINTLDKCVSLSYKDGLFKGFIDTWDLRKIGSTTINLSENQAINIAMQNAKNYS